MAHNFRVPFLVFCETYKFSKRSQIDSLADNEMADPSYLSSGSDCDPSEINYTLINLKYDLTPIGYINMVLSSLMKNRSNIHLLYLNYSILRLIFLQIVTELGKIPATSVPVILREFTNMNFIGKIKEIPSSQNKSD